MRRAKPGGLVLPTMNEDVSSDVSMINYNRNSIDQLEKDLEQMELSQTHKLSMQQFCKRKRDLGDIKTEQLKPVSDLGTGNSGVVSKVVHELTGYVMARKMIHLEVKPAIRSQILRELQILHDCNSPYIVGFYQAFPSDGEINICMEYMDGGSLDMVLKQAGRIPEPILTRIAIAVLEGLAYLREKHKIIHRDVKPSNVLINSQGDLKICDFGVSGQLIDSRANTFVGTRSYMSPERLKGTPYSVQSDLWSMGLSLVELALGKYPIPTPTPESIDPCFPTSDHIKEHYDAAKQGLKLRGLDEVDGNQTSMAIFELLECIVHSDPPRLPEGKFTPELVDFVSICLNREPQQRKDLRTLLQHEVIVRSVNETEIDVGFWARNVLGIPKPD